MPPARKHTKGMSPKHAVKAHISRSTGPNAPIFCSTTITKYESMSPNSQTGVRNDTRGKLANLDAEGPTEREMCAFTACLGDIPLVCLRAGGICCYCFAVLAI